MKRDFLDLWDITRDELFYLLKRAEEFKRGARSDALKGKVVALLFTKPSTRTRVSFEVGVRKLGGESLFLHEKELQSSRGEETADTARTLSRYVDALVVRNHSHAALKELALYASIPVVNALTELSHPCQTLSDLFTLKETFGRLEGLKLAWLGDGNNVCNSLMVGCAMAGVDLTVATPLGHEPNAYYYEKARRIARETGARIELTHDPEEAVKDADALYTDVWVSMGQQEKELSAFEPYRVTRELVEKTGKPALLLHCLPARKGQEVERELFEEQAETVFRQAENRLWAQMALLEHLLGRSA
ncbi:MAG: ornithine carbamoyltransferase [Aquificae bacterium]|nr:ornithine carbamoyltransferase [Aquificota bacterium]